MILVFNVLYKYDTRVVLKCSLFVLEGLPNLQKTETTGSKKEKKKRTLSSLARFSSSSSLLYGLQVSVTAKSTSSAMTNIFSYKNSISIFLSSPRLFTFCMFSLKSLTKLLRSIIV